MPTPQPLPRSLDAWLKQLDGVALPVPAVGHERVRRALGDSRRSLREIAELMQNCPTLALSVLREANRAAPDNPAESLEAALSRLGLKHIEELLQRLPAVAAEAMPRALRQALLISQHAMQQA
ncbi:MAG: HDOD domain-containing protein, partial [Pseudomonas sp.]